MLPILPLPYCVFFPGYFPDLDPDNTSVRKLRSGNTSLDLFLDLLGYITKPQQQNITTGFYSKIMVKFGVIQPPYLITLPIYFNKFRSSSCKFFDSIFPSSQPK